MSEAERIDNALAARLEWLRLLGVEEVRLRGLPRADTVPPGGIPAAAGAPSAPAPAAPRRAALQPGLFGEPAPETPEPEADPGPALAVARAPEATDAASALR
ncbi:MAG: hypothetical protein HY510_05340, partial [Acidobacteria bacterium]|nr:hypothetical protein [Acidobacteriota bacterium]